MNRLYILFLSMACVSTIQAQQQKAYTTMTRTVVVERE